MDGWERVGMASLLLCFFPSTQSLHKYREHTVLSMMYPAAHSWSPLAAVRGRGVEPVAPIQRQCILRVCPGFAAPWNGADVSLGHFMGAACVSVRVPGHAISEPMGRLAAAPAAATAVGYLSGSSPKALITGRQLRLIHSELRSWGFTFHMT